MVDRVGWGLLAYMLNVCPTEIAPRSSSPNPTSSHLSSIGLRGDYAHRCSSMLLIVYVNVFCS